MCTSFEERKKKPEMVWPSQYNIQYNITLLIHASGAVQHKQKQEIIVQEIFKGGRGRAGPAFIRPLCCRKLRIGWDEGERQQLRYYDDVHNDLTPCRSRAGLDLDVYKVFCKVTWSIYLLLLWPCSINHLWLVLFHRICRGVCTRREPVIILYLNRQACNSS